MSDSSIHPIELLSPKARNILTEGTVYFDSKKTSLWLLIQDASGWENWLNERKVPLTVDAKKLIYEAGEKLSLSKPEIDEVLANTRTDKSIPVCVYKGNEENSNGDIAAWSHLFHLDPSIVEYCPPDIKALVGEHIDEYRKRVPKERVSSQSRFPKIRSTVVPKVKRDISVEKAPLTEEKFKRYAELGRSNAKVQERICDLLSRICTTDDPAVVQRNCQAEIAWLESQDYKPATRASYVSAYRTALKDYFAEHECPETVMSERETVKGLITQHCSLDFMFASPADYEAINNKTQANTTQQRDNLTGFDASAAVDVTEQAVQSTVNPKVNIKLAQLGREIVSRLGKTQNEQRDVNGQKKYRICVNLSDNTMRIYAKDRGDEPILVDANGKIDHANSRVLPEDVQKFQEVVDKLRSHEKIKEPAVGLER